MNALRNLTLSMIRQSGWKVAVIFGFSVLLVLALFLARAHTASAASGATIASDQADYQPGASVTLTGAGWDSGEAVHIFVNDSVGNTWSLNSNPDPVADGSGSFTYSFSLPNSFIANYIVTATGPTSGTATTTFTDSNDCANNTNSIHPPDPNVSATFTTSGNTATYTLSSASGLNSSGGIPGLIEYCVDNTPQPVSVTASYDSWDASPPASPFGFSRPNGNPTNVPFDGNTYTIGTATFSGSVPTSQTIFLHVNDPGYCGQFEGATTCYVYPGTPQQQAKDLTVSTVATPSFTRTFKWGIMKDVDKTKITDSSGSATFNYTVSVTHDGGTDSGWQVTGTITVSNPNGSDVTGVNVTDADSNGGTCIVTNGTNVTVPTKGSADLSYTCTYSSAPSSGTDTASVTWPDIGSPHTSATGSASYDFGSVSPKLIDDSVSVTDTLGGTLGTVSSTDPSPTTFTYSFTVKGTGGTCVSQDNTATFTTDTTSATGSDSKTVTLCTPVDLKVAKDATPSFTRTFKWGITKNVDKTLVEQIGGTATFTYTVSVTHDSGTDSDWQVNGTITVSNPNDFEDIVVANVSDTIDNGGNCTVTGGTNVTVPAGKSVTLPYSCTYASAPSPGSGTNTATASWDQTAALTPGGSASGAATFDFAKVSPKLVDDSVSVSDSLGGNLGTISSTDPSPKTFTYSKTITVPATNCVFVNNTATFTTNTTNKTGSASQKVEVCGPAKTGALTMGYWQNKNGQGIITGGASTSGVCNSGTWLRQYAPFQDLSATASCSAVATYVTNVIKAANASGSSMNAMLKAQMLATALDVYFSDPALGGNKISAPAPIGGVKIDLTMICHMIDGSGGTATCSGTFENVSSAFGSATSMKVSDMLTYAAGQSNAGGSSWYGNVKSTQQLAKDAFDAINNQVAFAP